ncbi:hypothetical protein TRFO_34685 [Tritrichomonas foetus]|uniref:Uncharacterized protein n=1 Tax=Tritrichomonas foetus TaxID=1144522 RepID=A0A1J4JN74_9EUKA|nr:hypothetical protein TRFO_34685 [Tritrichomonas foetus]|eukprot:OHS98957.1 hypothetical protein TRFO_34685 [Tritrichomonas foetus]
MSKLPVHRHSVAKDSGIVPLGKSTRSNIPKPTKSRISTYQSKKDPKIKTIFKLEPTESALESRKLPSSLQGKPKLKNNSDLIDDFYNYVRTIGNSYFENDFFSASFPSALSTLRQRLKNKATTKIPSSKRKISRLSLAEGIPPSEIEKKNIPDLSSVFEKYKTLLKQQNNSLIYFRDFIILYCALVIFVCEEISNCQLSALYFLNSFLPLLIAEKELPIRENEASILVTVLIYQAFSDPIIRGHSINVLSQLIQYDTKNVYPRIRAGLELPDQHISSMCEEALQKFEVTYYPEGLEASNPPPPTFAKIPSNVTSEVAVKMLVTYLQAMEGDARPPKPIDLINNIIQTMNTFSKSPQVLENGSNCIRLLISIINQIPVEIASETLNLCLSLLSGDSYLSGADSFSALEAVQNLENALFDVVPVDTLLSAVAATIATTTEQRLPLLMTKFSEYYQYNKSEINQRQLQELSNALDSFHPMFNGRPPFLIMKSPVEIRLNNITESIERLLNPETVFQEMETVILQSPETINDYPSYIKGFLQRAYFFYTNRELEGMNEEQVQMAQDMVQQYQTITDEDIVGNGKYSVDTLSAQLEEIKNMNNPSW